MPSPVVYFSTDNSVVCHYNLIYEALPVYCLPWKSVRKWPSSLALGLSFSLAIAFVD